MSDLEEELSKIIRSTIRHSKNSGRQNTGIYTLVENTVKEIIACFKSQKILDDKRLADLEKQKELDKQHQ